MQLVVMAAAMVLAGVGQGCSFECFPTNISISVESCGLTKFVDSTLCAGLCSNTYPIYESFTPVQQNVCNGDWSFESTYIEGCPVRVTYPVARRCRCTTCNTANTDCGRFYRNLSGPLVL